jgi:hypothetical protein
VGPLSTCGSAPLSASPAVRAAPPRRLAAGLYLDSDVECWREGADMLAGYDVVLPVGLCILQRKASTTHQPLAASGRQYGPPFLAPPLIRAYPHSKHIAPWAASSDAVRAGGGVPGCQVGLLWQPRACCCALLFCL